MIGLIIGFIGEAVAAIGGVWEWIKSIKVVGRLLQGTKCLIEWYAWITLVRSVIDKLTAFDLSPREILELLKLDKLLRASSLEDVEEKFQNNLAAMAPALQDAKEISERAKLPESPWNGVHKPPYHSICISEVLYEFSNVAGTGSMIIMFNPEGFGNKPKPPHIIRYVDESEFAEFVNSKSWGNYWRWNYLLWNRKTAKQRRKRTSDILKEDEYPIPKSEGLDDYVERVLDLPEYADDLIASEFSELIQKGLDQSVYQLDLMGRAIENGNIGRGLERNGLRVTSLIQDKIQEIPGHLKRIVATNPVFKDVAAVTAQYKKLETRMRGLRDTFNDSMNLNSLSKEAIILSENFGELALFEAAMETGAIPNLNFLSESGLISNTAGKYAAVQRAEKSAAERFTRNYGKGKAATGQTYEDYLRKRGTYTDFKKRKDPEWEYKTAPLAKEEWEAKYAVKLENWKQSLLEEELAKLGINKFSIASFLKAPTCVPFIK